MASVIWIVVLFSLATLGLYTLSLNFPECTSTSSSCSALKFPTNIDELHKITKVLKDYQTNNFGFVFSLFSCAFLYKQTFGIPGSLFLNLLSGALFGVPCGTLLSTILTACGSTFCFLLSDTFGKQHIVRYFPNKVKYLQNMIDENLNGLFFFLLFLRLFPITPNWFLNLASPILNIPIHLFTLSVFIGLIPYIFICVQTGSMLSQITSLDDIITVTMLFKLGGMAIVALLPGFVMKKYRYEHKRD